MSENCSHNCGSCSSNCGNRKPADFLVAPNPHSSIKKVIGVVSGKGGVGKSMVTSTLAVLTQRKGKQTAILDADITGPSIPKAFGMKEKAYGTELGMMPCKTKTGIDVMSVNLLLDNETDPVVWRGPVIAETVKQFWRDVVWENEEYMFIDMPPGTGDVPLTVFQSIAIDGIIIVTSPQELVGMIVDKAVKMAEIMNEPIISSVLTAARNIRSSVKAILKKSRQNTTFPLYVNCPLILKSLQDVTMGKQKAMKVNG